jgi:hypothetical protein
MTRVRTIANTYAQELTQGIWGSNVMWKLCYGTHCNMGKPLQVR